jgi:hypothetical protein
VGVPGKTGLEILRSVIAKVVQQQEWIEVLRPAEAEGST